MNVQEVLKISKERKIKNKDSINKILDNIHKKIKYYATMRKETCVYIIPPIVEEHLIYDLSSVIKEVFKILDSEGFIVTAYPSGQLDICWNEKLVEEKVKTDAYLLKIHENKLKNLTKKNKNIDQRFAFLANPKKTSGREKSVDEQLDEQVEKILKQKEKTQKKYSKLLNS
jgi:hypothetical protein